MIASARSGKKTGPGRSSQHRDHEREDEDEHLADQEDLHVQHERAGDVGKRAPDVVPAEEDAMHLGPAGRLRDRHDHHRQEDGGADEGDRHPAGPLRLQAQPSEQARAPRLYFKIGAPVAFASHCWSSCLSVPFERSVPSALFTHATSEFPFWKHEAEVLTARLCGELPEHLGVRHLDGRDVERGRQVDHEPVDLLVLESLDRAGVRREDRGLLRGLDLVSGSAGSSSCPAARRARTA